MGMESNQINWRQIFQPDPNNCKVTNYPDPGSPSPVEQADATKLLCTTTPDSVTPQEVVQDTAADLKVTNTPDGETLQPVSQTQPIRGIWPAVGSLRVSGDNVQSGSGSAIVYTVPANKKLFISSTQVTIRTDADGDVNGRMAVRNDADTFQYYICYMYMIIKSQFSVAQQFSPALEASAAWDIYMVTTHAAVAVRGLFHGWLEDA